MESFYSSIKGKSIEFHHFTHRTFNKHNDILRSTLVLGFLPQELLGTSIYEYYHPDDIPTLAETHKLSLLRSTVVKTPPYRLSTKSGSFVSLQSEWKSFRNPWTKDVEYLIAKNLVIPSDVNQFGGTVGNQSSDTFDFFNQRKSFL